MKFETTVETRDTVQCVIVRNWRLLEMTCISVLEGLETIHYDEDDRDVLQRFQGRGTSV